MAEYNINQAAVRRQRTVYLPTEIATAVSEYRSAGYRLNISRLLQQALVDRFRVIERQRKLLHEPAVYENDELVFLERIAEEDGYDRD
jgi:hypothetical protein